MRESIERTAFPSIHAEPYDVNESRLSRMRTKSACEQPARVEKDVNNLQRHNSETRELGQLISDLGISKPRALSVGPTLSRSAQSQQAPESVYRAVSPGTRLLGSSAFSPNQQQQINVSVRPMCAASAQSGAPGTAIGAPAHGLQGQSLLTVDMFSKEQLNAIFNLAQTFRLCVHKERSLDHILRVSRAVTSFE